MSTHEEKGSTKKLNKLDKDIIQLLRKHEPNRLRFSEIQRELYPSHTSHYKSYEIFGSALSFRLPRLRCDGLIVKEDLLYGSPNSRSPEPQPSTDETSRQNEFLLLLKDCYLQPHSRQKTLKALRLLHELDPQCRKLIDEALINSLQRKKETQVIIPNSVNPFGRKAVFLGKTPNRPVVVEPSLEDMTSNLDEYLNDRELEALTVSILALIPN